MDFLSRITFESKVIPGAVVMFRRVTATTRSIYLSSQATYRAQIREIQRKRKPLDDLYNAAIARAKASAKIEVDKLIESEGITREEAEKRAPLNVDLPDEQFLEWGDLLEQQRIIERDALGLSGLRAQFVSIEGVTVDGHVPTIDELIQSAPLELTEELVEAANGIAGLSPTERGESPWPGISPLPVDGPSLSTTAIPVVSEPAPA